MTNKDLYFSFDGRTPRSDYWLKYVLPFIVIQVIVEVIAYVSGIGTALGLVYLLLIYPSIAVGVKS
jgi:uncharacterized membrane protein YhaH (DUF805 family)